MEKQVRNYKLKDVDMLISAATITESAINNKTALLAKRSTWADPFFKDFQTKIDQTIQTHLGVDSAKKLREATQIVYSIQANAMRDLAEVKVQIDEDFKQDTAQRTEILNTLGFTNYYTNVRKKDQEALINLLYQFKTNLTSDLRTAIVNKGTAAESLETILNYADTLKNANISQEGNKGTRKEITNQAVNAFNEIYDQAISIAKIAAKILKDNPALKDQFSFNKVSKNLNNTKKTTPKS